MNSLERWCISLRHHFLLKNLFLWDIVRPLYNMFLSLLASSRGIERIMNGTDPIRVHPRWRGVQESYEPAVWKHLMGNIRTGDVVVDVGAFIGVYTVAQAKRVGPQGLILAFEPEPTNFEWLERHVLLNHVQENVRLSNSAVGEKAGEINFDSGKDSQSCVSGFGKTKVPVTTLDRELKNRRVDIIKIDTEGYEENVLRGALGVLKDASRSPRLIYIEVHPYAWEKLGVSSQSLLNLLEECNFSVTTIDGKIVNNINFYGEIVARNRDSR